MKHPKKIASTKHHELSTPPSEEIPWTFEIDKGTHLASASVKARTFFAARAQARIILGEALHGKTITYSGVSV